MTEIVDVGLLSTTFLTLFVIMDPPGTVPVFLALTSTMTARQRRVAARQATAVAFGVILAFTLFGQYILDFLHISVPALQLSGGLLLLLVAMELLTGKQEEPGSSPNGVNVALVPLGTPLLAGPGAIVAAMLAVQDVEGPPGWVAIGVALVGVHLVLWAAMRFAGVIHRVLGDGGTTLVTRIAGLLLAAIAVQLMADAVFAFVDMHY
ncbi:MarC family protein [Georgenia sp. TF02-10]|uniref:MarC family protein n=1 Tax=Georgenia sp. TF02-10 TaxID=2917725 RepID=UPI001FA73D73|nr:MarC family protein [Georgenia sp. TF02-10]UNX54166.1 MarC family protein [Georgenia sp. TF02-10]